MSRSTDTPTWWIVVAVIVFALAGFQMCQTIRTQQACRARGGEPMTDRWNNTACFNAKDTR